MNYEKDPFNYSKDKVLAALEERTAPYSVLPEDMYCKLLLADAIFLAAPEHDFHSAYHRADHYYHDRQKHISTAIADKYAKDNNITKVVD